MPIASLDTTAPDIAAPAAGWRYAIRLLRGDTFAVASLTYLILLVIGAGLGSYLFADVSLKMNLALRNAPPLSFEHGYLFALGADSLGRPIVPRLLVAARTTLLVSVSVVLCSMTVGAILGLLAGFYDRVVGTLIMRMADLVMSFPSLLLAVIVLYVLEPRAANVVIVLAITRTPVFIRVARAEVLEVRERLFVESARAAGATDLRIMLVHILPVVAPTILTVATLDFANVMLAESSLSFLGIGIQQPAFTWGSMVATGRNFLTTAWWLAVFPGLAILLTALAMNLLSNWLRIATNPMLRWRLERTPEASRNDEG